MTERKTLDKLYIWTSYSFVKTFKKTFLAIYREAAFLLFTNSLPYHALSLSGFIYEHAFAVFREAIFLVTIKEKLYV